MKDNTLGVIKWYSEENRYGVIEEVNTEKEVFLHFNNWIDNQSISTLTDSKLLVFEMREERNKVSAKNCRFFDYSIEDYAILYDITIKCNKKLCVKGKYNKIKYISELLDNNTNIDNFNTLVEKKIEKIENSQYIVEIEKLSEWFPTYLDYKVINKESLKRFRNNESISFKRNILATDLIHLNEIELSFILNNLEIDDNLIEKIANHPELVTDFRELFSKIDNQHQKIKLIFIAIENRFTNIEEYLFPFINSLESQDFIETVKAIETKLNTNSLSYDLQSEIKKYLLNKSNRDLNYKAYKNGLINIDKTELVENYLDLIDKDEFIKIETFFDNKTMIIKSILDLGTDEKLVKYIIQNFENFEIDNFQIFFEFGIQRLFELSEENQVLYLKKLFYLKVENKISFNTYDLSLFIDIKILKKASNNKNDIDFSTFFIIDLISKFSTNEGFLGTRELIKNVLNIIQFDKKRKVQIDKYFDKCNGYGKEILPAKDEQIAKKEFTTRQGTTNYYFKISFPFNEAYNEDIKQISGSKYNADEQFWAVPLRSETEVLLFAKKNNFIVDLQDGRKYEHNQHLVNIVKNEKEKPIGYNFCCGQESQKLSSAGNKFWWCKQNKCFENNIERHENWEEYTLYDFMKILNLNLQEKNSLGQIFEEGLYTRFVSLLNRFNRLLERLYCDKCGDILYPFENGNFQAHSVTQFVCKNENCTQHEEIVYLNNCLNGQCNAIIDNRNSKKCPNGWYICSDCGSCCSHVAYERRLNNLSLNGGIMHDSLLTAVKNKIGHFEKAEYYCCKCGQFMIENSESLYKCNDCDISYDLSPYNHIFTKQIHKYLRDEKYPSESNRIREQLKNIILREKNELLNDRRTKSQIFGILFNKKVEIDGEFYCLKTFNDRHLTNEIFN